MRSQPPASPSGQRGWLREARVLELGVASYRDETAKLTGESHRTVDGQLGRARRKLGATRTRSAVTGATRSPVV